MSTAVETPQATREVYRDLVAALMPRDPRIVCLDSDTGLFDGVDWDTAAERYVNLGIAEQNLMGVAAGLARSGWVPLVNTMATFASTRALEAVKLDIAYNDLPVRIVATHSGLSAGNLGPTHHSLEDIAIMRLIPNMTVVQPAGATATGELFRQCVDLPGPVYFRLGRKPTPEPETDEPVRLGHAQELRQGDDVTIVATGPHPVNLALEAADALNREGTSAGVLNMHTIKPLDAGTLRTHAARTGAVVTVEEHWQFAGLGSAVAEVLAESGSARVERVGIADTFVSMAGDQPYLLERCGVTAAGVQAAARRVLNAMVNGHGH